MLPNKFTNGPLYWHCSRQTLGHDIRAFALCAGKLIWHFKIKICASQKIIKTFMLMWSCRNFEWQYSEGPVTRGSLQLHRAKTFILFTYYMYIFVFVPKNIFCNVHCKYCDKMLYRCIVQLCHQIKSLEAFILYGMFLYIYYDSTYIWHS